MSEATHRCEIEPGCTCSHTVENEAPNPLCPAHLWSWQRGWPERHGMEAVLGRITEVLESGGDNKEAIAIINAAIAIINAALASERQRATYWEMTAIERMRIGLPANINQLSSLHEHDAEARKPLVDALSKLARVIRESVEERK